MFTFMTTSPTWVEVREGADDKVQRGDGQHGQQYQLESDDPLDTRQVDPEQRQQHRRRHAAHRPLALHSQHLRHRLRETCDVHGSGYTLRGERQHESGDNTGKCKRSRLSPHLSEHIKEAHGAPDPAPQDGGDHGVDSSTPNAAVLTHSDPRHHRHQGDQHDQGDQQHPEQHARVPLDNVGDKMTSVGHTSAHFFSSFLSFVCLSVCINNVIHILKKHFEFYLIHFCWKKGKTDIITFPQWVIEHVSLWRGNPVFHMTNYVLAVKLNPNRCSN